MRQIQFRFFTFVLLIIQPSFFNLAQTKYDSSPQESIDKPVATIKINDADLFLSIRYSDVMFQLAITPEVNLSPPTSADFERALQSVINQRLIEFMAIGSYPAKTEIKNDADYQRALQASINHQLKRKAAIGPPPTEAEINDQIRTLLAVFPSAQELEKRLRIVGFNSLADDNFRRRMELRILIERLINSRFRSRVVITPKEEEDYYQNVFLPEFRRRNPGTPVPGLNKQRLQIRGIITEARTVKAIEDFLRDLKQKAEIILLEQSKPANISIQSPKKD
jgi:hypothetical protein